MEKSSGFKSGKYGSQSAGVHNYAMFSLRNSWVVLALYRQALNPAGRCSCRLDICPLDPGDNILSQKVQVNIGIN
jgi:hypothetical protein